ncbi:ribonucleoside triphosphate reductase [Lacticaseibacillus rhamnosus MTCC 5462]|nr:ribonucleoside triphosphate reductase [Lacticaseibacillus rhamnosus MTCC 5462]
MICTLTTPIQIKTKLVLDISDIRPYGAKIHGFGGTASGPMPLVEMFFDINNVINERVGQS